MKAKSVFALLVIGGILLITLYALVSPGGAGVSLVPAEPIIALVNIEGALATGTSGGTSILSIGTAGSDSIVATLAEARQNPLVKAVVLRVNSPGGSPAASQEISEELATLRASGKVVVTSMADVAASGAYWIAANTDHIMADPGTMTGSIGVIWELANYEDLYRKLGIQYHTFTSGPYKDMGSPSRRLTEEEKRIVQAMVDDMFGQFVDTVATGRNLPREKVLSLADGRVFTGSQAKAVGLVDSLGGLQKAIAKAAEMAGVTGGYEVRELGRRSPWEIFLGEVRALLGDIRAAARLAGSAGAGGLDGAAGLDGASGGNLLDSGEGPK